MRVWRVLTLCKWWLAGRIEWMTDNASPVLGQKVCLKLNLFFLIVGSLLYSLFFVEQCSRFLCSSRLFSFPVSARVDFFTTFTPLLPFPPFLSSVFLFWSPNTQNTHTTATTANNSNNNNNRRLSSRVLHFCESPVSQLRSSAKKAATTALVVATRAAADRCGPGHVVTSLRPTGTEEGQGRGGGERVAPHGQGPEDSSSPAGALQLVRRRARREAACRPGRAAGATGAVWRTRSHGADPRRSCAAGGGPARRSRTLRHRGARAGYRSAQDHPRGHPNASPGPWGAAGGTAAK